MTANTDPAIKRGYQWWSFLDIEREGSFFFLFFCNIQSFDNNSGKWWKNIQQSCQRNEKYFQKKTIK